MDKQISISELKTHCYRVLENIAYNHKSIVISKRGKPIARIIPIDKKENNTPLAGMFSARCSITSDLIEPIDFLWDVEEKKKKEEIKNDTTTNYTGYAYITLVSC